MKSNIFALLLLPLTYSPAFLVHADEMADQIKLFDSDHSETLSENELAEYARKHDPLVQKYIAEDRNTEFINNACLSFAEDALTMLPGERKEISLIEAELFVRRVSMANKKLEDTTIGWKGLEFSRTLSDPSDPRKKQFYDRPLVLSYSVDDNREGQDGSFLLLGTIKLYTWTVGPDNSPTQISPGLELNVDSQKKANESDVALGLNVSHVITPSHPSFISSHTFGVTPTIQTDRDFQREAGDITLSYSFASEAIFRAGYVSYLGLTKPISDKEPELKIFWKPELLLETGNIWDANENEELEIIEESGGYLRIAPKAQLVLSPSRLSSKLNITLDYVYRFDVEQNWQRGYLKSAVNYNISKNIALTLMYRNGRQPPDFADTDMVLFGIGLNQ